MRQISYEVINDPTQHLQYLAPMIRVLESNMLGKPIAIYSFSIQGQRIKKMDIIFILKHYKKI